jgi:hypothetical protein
MLPRQEAVNNGKGWGVGTRGVAYMERREHAQEALEEPAVDGITPPAQRVENALYHQDDSTAGETAAAR